MLNHHFSPALDRSDAPGLIVPLLLHVTLLSSCILFGAIIAVNTNSTR
jgi:hypothetical protein